MDTPTGSTNYLTPHGTSFRTKTAFTLIEVLVVVAIMALLMAILLPSLRNARVQARRTVCLSNMRQLAVGIASYMVDSKTKPPQWPGNFELERRTDGVALWQGGPLPNGFPTRLGQLYPRYIGKNENVFYCPDAGPNGLLAKDNSQNSTLGAYGWKNWGKAYTYGSYEYRPRYHFKNAGDLQPTWVGIYKDFRRGVQSIAADGFSGEWHSFGPYPVHTPIQDQPRILYYNVAYADGSGKPMRDYVRNSPSAPGGKEFKTRAGPPSQRDPYTNTPRADGTGQIYVLPPEYTHLRPNADSTNVPVPDAAALNGEHIDRAWRFFEGK